MFDFDPQNFRIEDLERITREGEEAMRALTEAIAEMDEVIGEGEAAEGALRVVMDSTGHVIDVTLDPRALRLGADALADAMREAFNAAQDDLHDQTDELVSDALPAYVAEADAGPGAMRDHFEQIQRSFDRAMADRQAAFDQIRETAAPPEPEG